LKDTGKMPSDRARFIIIVMGCNKESRQDLRRKVGIVSREQVALEDIWIAFLTSSASAGRKDENSGGVVVGVM
jgi:hypothetical protein